ncbi:MAG: S8 family serine peptidase [Ignavibacteria bacterium]|jgi:subtilisin family serine protease
MTKKIIKYYCVILLLLITNLAISQSQKVIIKLKPNTPATILNDFGNNNVKSGNTSIAKLCRDFNIANSKQLFQKLLRNFKEEELSAFNLDKIFVADINTPNFNQVKTLLSKNEYVEYVQGNNKYGLFSFIPNDPYYSYQYYLTKTNIQQVWDVTQGDSSIIIGIIDSGSDFLHPDLNGSFKINYNEIPNNNIDDDNNGFIDDYLGWNFAGNNNNPTDDNIFSHGTAIAGLLGAKINNGIGIASISPKCKLLTLKAFDSQGIGYDNDVATAILYAISRGVKVLNLSFGDYVYSYLLRDVIRFAYSKNIVMIASAGNDASDVLHYPSAFDEVISVGASDNEDRRASFSAFGETVDIFAPGYQILSTSILGKGSSEFNNDYAYINGTSFSAPVVTGVAGLLLSRNKNLTNEEIRGILVSTTDYFPGQSSWDHNYSSGMLNAFNAINYYNTPSIVRIYNPYQDLSDTIDTIPILISTASPLFQSYSIYYGVGENPFNFIPLVSNINSQILKDTAYKWNLSNLPDTSITLRLAINSNTGKTIEHRLIFYYNRRVSSILDLAYGEIIDEDNYSELITFSTKYKSIGKIYYKRKNVSESYKFIYADGNSGNIGMVSDVHYGLLKGKDLIPNTEYEFYIESQSLNGKINTLQDTSFHFIVNSQISNYGFIKKGFSLPLFQTCNTIYDVFNIGKKDLFTNDIKNNLKLSVYEFSNGVFNKIQNYTLPDYIVTRDLTYLNSNNKIDLLTSTSRNGAVYEAANPYQLPTVKIWSDEGNDNFWSARFSDINNNNKKEILGFGINGLRILEYNSGNFDEIATLPYSTVSSQANSQNVLVEDFDSDGKNELVFIDTYFPGGSLSFQNLGINIYKNTSGNIFTKVFTDTLERFLKGDNVISGDFDGDGKKEFAFGTISNSSELIQYYSLFTYKFINNNFILINRADIYNSNPNADVSTKSGDIDNDNQDEVLVNAGKSFYVLKYMPSQNKYEPVYYMKDVNSVNQLVFDFDGNGIKEIGLNNLNDSMCFYEKDIPFKGPETPLNFISYGIDSNKVYLKFLPVINADYYRIYRADNDSTYNFVLYDSTLSTNYLDLNVLNRKNYLYRVTTMDTSSGIKESKPTNYVNVFVHNKSKLLQVNSEGNGFISVTFSEKVNIAIPAPNSFVVSNFGEPKFIALKSSYEYLLSFGSKLPNGIYSIKSNNLVDFYNSPLDTNSITFAVNQVDSVQFYIKYVSLVDKYKLKVEFNLNTDTVTCKNPGNYTFEPFGFKILSVEIDNNNRNILYMNLSNNSYIGASGRNYLLKAYNIYSSTGVRISDGAGGSFGLIFNKENLNDVFVYPNPHTKTSKQDFITFANLTRTAVIYIYDLTGRYLAKVEETSGNGGVEWNLKTLDGKEVPTGIYIFKAEGSDSNGKPVDDKTGKFMIVR